MIGRRSRRLREDTETARLYELGAGRRKHRAFQTPQRQGHMYETNPRPRKLEERCKGELLACRQNIESQYNHTTSLRNQWTYVIPDRDGSICSYRLPAPLPLALPFLDTADVRADGIFGYPGRLSIRQNIEDITAQVGMRVMQLDRVPSVGIP